MNGSVASVLVSDVGVEYRHGELVWTQRVWKPGSLHGVPWRAQFGYAVGGVSRQLATDAVVCTVSQCIDSWQLMQWYATSHDVTTAGNGCSGMQRLSVSLSTAGNGYSGTPWTLDQVKYLFLSVDN